MWTGQGFWADFQKIRKCVPMAVLPVGTLMWAVLTEGIILYLKSLDLKCFLWALVLLG